MARPRKGEEKNSTETIAVRLSPDLKHQIETAARERDEPYSVVVIEALRQYFETHGRTQHAA